MAIDKRIDLKNIPKHVAIIMDGNGRWAKKNGEERIFGHQNGVKSVKESTEAAAELGVKYITLYAFSTENWSRPKEEVDALMSLLVHTIHSETESLNNNNIKLHAIGDLKSLPPDCYRELNEAIENTKNNTHLNLVLALSYSSRWEINNAIKNISIDIKDNKLEVEDIDDKLISNYLTTKNIPDPELLIRTSGEQRISNFLLWQLAYSELYFTDKLWPEFTKQDFFDAIVDYQQRERRFGKTSEQITQP
jgi:undecaprenyl diphosphate synthase